MNQIVAQKNLFVVWDRLDVKESLGGQIKTVCFIKKILIELNYLIKSIE